MGGDKIILYFDLSSFFWPVGDVMPGALAALLNQGAAIRWEATC